MIKNDIGNGDYIDGANHSLFHSNSPHVPGQATPILMPPPHLKCMNRSLKNHHADISVAHCTGIRPCDII